ncbi:phage/plasmid replication protein, II/X family [Paraburkholderia sp. BCC1885]|uniref:phage/plasmid replication protein, II/X family n=1 Tax=Paraburkholderia sp. BCC1885 TaxID=2562669 RepID=UPI001181F5B9|nr:phage/plasmid replication protein, II/X family [Paraburkholderia sp. BCC1885]
MNFRHLEECIMLDTVGFTIGGIDARLPKNMSINEEPGWSTGHMNSPSGKQSFDVRYVEKHNRLRIEGSAAAYFQGHNIVASNDLVMTVISMLKAVKDTHEIPIPLWDAYALALGRDIVVTRIDTPAMLRVPAGLTSGAVVNGLALAGLRCGINTALYHHESFYFDQNSQSVSLKGYLKDVQMDQQRKKAKLPDTENADLLLELARSTVRIEPVYRQKYFNAQSRFDGSPPAPADFGPSELARMFAGVLEKYNLRGSLRAHVNDEELQAAGIPRQHRAAVMLWQHGHDMLQHFDGDQRALARVRMLLKKNHSIDIGGVPPRELEMPVRVGEILCAENFVPVPDAIRRDPALFHTFDVKTEWRGICDRLGITGGIGHVFIDPYEAHADDLPDTPQMPDFGIG